MRRVLSSAGRADRVERRHQLGQAVDRTVGRGGAAELAGQTPSRSADPARFRARQHRAARRPAWRGGARGDVDILELVGHDIDLAAKASSAAKSSHAARVLAPPHHPPAARPRARRCGSGSPVGGRHRQHPAQLAAAQNADGLARWNHLASRSARPLGNTVGLRGAAGLEPLGQRRIGGRQTARRRAARHWSRPPLRWPACRPESRRASARSTAGCPARSAPSIAPARPAPAGASCDATMPGRCAAPPAPAMITSQPSSAAVVGKLDQPLRGAVGRDDARHAARPACRARRRHASSSASRTGCP